MPNQTLPFTTIKKMSKTGTDIKAVTQDATVMITKATELLLEALTAKGAAVMASEQRRELKYGDVGERSLWLQELPRA